MMTDPIADMLTRIRNAHAVKKTAVVLPYSKVKLVLADLLVREGWLAGVEARTAEQGDRGVRGGGKEIVLALRYLPEGGPAIHAIRRISKPGRRVYVTHGAVPVVKRGTGTAVISTPKGMMTSRDAKKAGVGGEVVCEVY